MVTTFRNPVSILTLMTCSLVLKMVQICFHPLFVSLKTVFPNFSNACTNRCLKMMIDHNDMIFLGLGQFFHISLPYAQMSLQLACPYMWSLSCDRRVMFLHTVKRNCLSLASAVLPMPSFQIRVRNTTVKLMSPAENPFITFLLHAPEYFGRSSCYLTYLTNYLCCSVVHYVWEILSLNLM